MLEPGKPRLWDTQIQGLLFQRAFQVAGAADYHPPGLALAEFAITGIGFKEAVQILLFDKTADTEKIVRGELKLFSQKSILPALFRPG